MPANLETSTVATGVEKIKFNLTPKKGNAKECSNYYTFALISHTSKVILKSFKLGFNSMWTENFQMFKLDLEKAKEPEIKLQTSVRSWKKVENSRKTDFCFSDYAKTFDCIDHKIKMWKIHQEMEILNHLTCLLWNVYAGQETTVRTGHGTPD